MNENKGKIVVLGMSGGVDSSVAAFLLKEAGYTVKGVFMKNWSDTKDEEGDCAWRKDREDALRVATQLEIPFETIDFEKEYKEEVFEYMISEYQQARTPNPDVMCNKKIKFGVFFEHAEKIGADYVATGHYARILKEDNGKYVLAKGKDNNKDQSYFLHQIKKELLSKIIFPVGEYEKEEIRKIAQDQNLVTASKKDSQGICFVGKVPMKEFLGQRIVKRKGKVIDTDGNVLGEHDGVEFFTIGQRQGIGIGGRGPLYVIKRDLEENVLTVTNDKTDARLYKNKLIIPNMHWLVEEVTDFPWEGNAKIRYRQEDQEVTVNKIEGNVLECTFKEPQWAVSNGQSLVLYEGDICLGGGVIET